MTDQTYSLPMVQGARLRVGFRHKVDGVAQSLEGLSFRGAIRAKADPAAELLLDLSPYLALDANDNTQLWLDVPGPVTAALSGRAMARDTVSWDIFMWPTYTPDNALLLLEGAVDFDPSATDMRAVQA